METNIERWRFYNKDVSSPDSFIDWGFYFAITAALQRRVWLGSLRSPLFANMYVILTAEPGIGKGLVIKQVDKLLRHHKAVGGDKVNAQSKFALEQKSIITVGADATSCEGLISDLSKSITYTWYNDDKLQKKTYIHSSCSFCLEEISSLFRKKSEDLVNFLIKVYDCGNYRYVSLGRGEDFIKNPCVSLIGGTTPGFMQRVFSEALLTDGFAGRTVFVYAVANRFYRFSPPIHTAEQIKQYDKILEHIKAITELFGEVKVDPDILASMETWWGTDGQTKRANKSQKLIPYYTRKNILLQKLAMAVHFAESTTMELTEQDFLTAMTILEKTEKYMHLAVSYESKNPLSKVTNDIFKYLTVNGKHTSNEILVEFYENLPEQKKSLESIMTFLLAAKKIKVVEGNKYEAI